MFKAAAMFFQIEKTGDFVQSCVHISVGTLYSLQIDVQLSFKDVCFKQMRLETCQTTMSKVTWVDVIARRMSKEGFTTSHITEMEN